MPLLDTAVHDPKFADGIIIMECLHWQSLLAKPSATATFDSHVTVTTVLVLAALGGAA